MKKVDKKPKLRKEKKPTDKLADKTALTKFLQGIFGDAQKKTLRRLWKRAQEINKLEPKYEKMSDKELASQTEIFKEKNTGEWLGFNRVLDSNIRSIVLTEDKKVIDFVINLFFSF